MNYKLKRAVIAKFSELPQEAFNFICGNLVQWGLTSGGFQNESKEALKELGEIASEFLDSTTKDK